MTSAQSSFIPLNLRRCRLFFRNNRNINNKSITATTLTAGTSTGLIKPNQHLKVLNRICFSHLLHRCYPLPKNGQRQQLCCCSCIAGAVLLAGREPAHITIVVGHLKLQAVQLLSIDLNKAKPSLPKA